MNYDNSRSQLAPHTFKFISYDGKVAHETPPFGRCRLVH